MNQKKEKKQKDDVLLECERWWIFAFMMFAGGYYGAYTYTCRGGVFCNAQTANFVLLGMSIGKADWGKALYYLIPMAAYLGGTMISEFVPKTVKRLSHIRWDTVFVAIEIIIVLILGFIPDSAPVQISQVIVNFMCSMQYNTFRQAEHIPSATTFCTNHIRQAGSYLVKWLKHKKHSLLQRSLFHFGMILVFVVGVIVSTVLCTHIGGKAIWCVEVVLVATFIDLLHADLTKEKDLLDKVPSGH